MEKKNPKVTVVIPAYNAENYIIQALDTVLQQTTKEELEVFVINDCSTDNTAETVRKYIGKLHKETDDSGWFVGEQNQRRNVILLENESSSGVAETRNYGICKAKGEYIAFLDADDWWSLDKLEKQILRIQEKNAVLCYTARELMTAHGETTGRIISVPENTDYKSLLRTNVIPCASVLMRTEVAREFYMTHDELHEDYILWLRVLKKYRNVCGINEPLLKSRLSQGGKSRNKVKSAKMQFGVYRLMGIGIVKSMFYFGCYTINGFRKYHG